MTPMPPSFQVATTSTPACFGVKLELHTSGWGKRTSIYVENRAYVYMYMYMYMNMFMFMYMYMYIHIFEYRIHQHKK